MVESIMYTKTIDSTTEPYRYTIDIAANGFIVHEHVVGVIGKNYIASNKDQLIELIDKLFKI